VTGRSGIAGKREGDLLKVNTVAVEKFRWMRLVGCCLALWLAGCAPQIYETPYTPPPLPPQPAPAPAVSRQVFYVAVNRLNLRGCAGMDCPKISMLEQNEVVEKLGEMDDWYEVSVKRDGRRGWVNSRYLSPEPVTPTVEAPPPPEVAPSPPPRVAPAPAPVEKPAPPAKPPVPTKPPVVEKPKPAKPGEAPPAPKKKPEEGKPAKPAKPGEPTVPARKPAPAAEKPAPPAEKPAPPVQKPAPPAKPSPAPEEPEQPKKIRIM